MYNICNTTVMLFFILKLVYKKGHIIKALAYKHDNYQDVL